MINEAAHWRPATRIRPKDHAHRDPIGLEGHEHAPELPRRQLLGHLIGHDADQALTSTCSVEAGITLLIDRRVTI